MFNRRLIRKKVRLIAVILWIGLLKFMSGQAQSVAMLCTQVNTSGDIDISWTSTTVPVGYQYEIYGCQNLSGTYILLGNVPFGINTFTHVGASGNAGRWFYVVKATPVSPTSGQDFWSDTLGSILLILEDSGTGPVKLRWVAPRIPPFSTHDTLFTIDRSRNSVWSILLKQIDTLYYDTVTFCNEIADYQIRLPDSRGCDNISAIQSALLRDRMAPQNPQLDSVSVNPNTGNTEIGWNRSPSPDVFGYIIYIWKGKWIAVDTVFGADNTFYIDTANMTDEKSQEYRVAAIDTCRNASTMGEFHNTIFVSMMIEKCDSLVILSWNRYNNMPDSVTGYRIWASQNGSPFSILNVVDNNSSSYNHYDINTFSTYQYYVQAFNINNGYSSSSPIIKVEFDSIPPKGSVWLRYVSVLNNRGIEVIGHVPDTVLCNTIFLLKSVNGGMSFSKIGRQNKVAGQEIYQFNDYNVNVSDSIYTYLLALADECDVMFAFSDSASNILLRALPSAEDSTSIVWSNYNGFGTRLNQYDLLRQTQTETSLQQIDNLSPTLSSYEEDVWPLASRGAKFYYQVAACEDNTNPLGFQDKSYSNVVEICKEALIYIPNSFRPMSSVSENAVFRPVLSYVDIEDYSFAIYDRWGNAIFHTRDISDGWNGYTNGGLSPMGIYSYLIVYRLNETKLIRKYGKVTLLE